MGPLVKQHSLMGAVDAMRMAKSRRVPGNIHRMAHGKRLGVDLSVWLYQMLGFISVAEGRDFHWAARAFVNRGARLAQNGVTPVFVADCPVTSPAKQLTRERRIRAKAGLSEIDGDAFPDPALEELLSQLAVPGTAADTEEVDGGEPRARPDPINVHGEYQSVVIAALRDAGFVVVIAPAEADHQLAHMFYAGEIDGVLTVDSDLLIMGVTVYTGVSWQAGGECIRIVVSDLWKPLADSPAWDYDPTGSLDYPKREEWDMEKLFELYEAIADDIVQPGASKTAMTVGMCANQYLYERGGAFLAGDEGTRARLAASTPEGARMQRHMELHAKRVEAAKSSTAATAGTASRRRSSGRGREYRRRSRGRSAPAPDAANATSSPSIG